jgi:hypothetical protein
LYKARVAQFAQVLAYGGLGQAKLLHQVAVDAGIAARQVLQYGYARRMGERFSQLGQFILRRCE